MVVGEAKTGASSHYHYYPSYTTRPKAIPDNPNKQRKDISKPRNEAPPKSTTPPSHTAVAAAASHPAQMPSNSGTITSLTPFNPNTLLTSFDTLTFLSHLAFRISYVCGRFTTVIAVPLFWTVHSQHPLSASASKCCLFLVLGLNFHFWCTLDLRKSLSFRQSEQRFAQLTGRRRWWGGSLGAGARPMVLVRKWVRMARARGRWVGWAVGGVGGEEVFEEGDPEFGVDGGVGEGGVAC